MSAVVALTLDSIEKHAETKMTTFKENMQAIAVGNPFLRKIVTYSVLHVRQTRRCD